MSVQAARDGWPWPPDNNAAGRSVQLRGGKQIASRLNRQWEPQAKAGCGWRAVQDVVQHRLEGPAHTGRHRQHTHR